MSTIVAVGAQWGDEGKGKVVDLLTEKADCIVRFQGGNNAGHTLVVDGTQHILHIVPSGVLHKGKICVIGNGLVVNPFVLIDEIKRLREFGIELTPENLLISERAHLIMPYHEAIDHAREAAKGKTRIGTTGRGIGPCYEDKASRFGIRAIDLLDPTGLEEKVLAALKEKNFLLKNMFGQDPIDPAKVIDQALEAAPLLREHIRDVSVFLSQKIKSGSNLLFEGAQGAHLDIDHGTYPFVTSSNPSASGAATGAGIGPRYLDHVVGIMKAYTTRVGSGPFVTELGDGVGAYIQEKGREFGATTGRKRRCGWLDLVLVADAVRWSSIDSLAVTKLDILGGLDDINVATAYRLNGRLVHSRPTNLNDMAKCKPIYETFSGWKEDISGIRDYTNLPRPVKNYLEFIESKLETPISLISVGPERESTIIKKHPFS